LTIRDLSVALTPGLLDRGCETVTRQHLDGGKTFSGNTFPASPWFSRPVWMQYLLSPVGAVSCKKAAALVLVLVLVLFVID